MAATPPPLRPAAFVARGAGSTCQGPARRTELDNRCVSWLYLQGRSRTFCLRVYLRLRLNKRKELGGGALLKVSGHRPVIMADLFKMALVWFMQYRSNAQDKMKDMFQSSKLRLILKKSQITKGREGEGYWYAGH